MPTRSRASARPEHVGGGALPDPRRALPSAGRHRPPRRGRLGLCQGGDAARRRGSHADRGDRHPRRERPRQGRRDQPRHDPRRQGGAGGRRRIEPRRPSRRPAPADQDDPAAGVRVRAGEADPRPDRRLGLAPRLHLAIGARRDGHGRRHRSLRALLDALDPRLQGEPDGPHAGAVPLHGRAARAPAMGGHGRHDAGLLAGDGPDADRRTTTSMPAGAPGGSRRRRSAARAWPNASRRAASPTSSSRSRSTASGPSTSSAKRAPPRSGIEGWSIER